MPDKKVYGMYENKCKVEVIPREDIKKMMIDISVTPNDGIKTKTATCPDGCNESNTVVLGINVSQYSGKTEISTGSYCISNGSIQNIAAVMLDGKNIWIYINTDLLGSTTDKVTVWINLLRYN